MTDFIDKDWSGNPFEVFGLPHLVMLALIALVTVVAVRWGTGASEDARRRFRFTVVVAHASNTALWHLWNVSIGRWSPQILLPLHLCSVMGLVSMTAMLTRYRLLAQLLWLLGFGGAIQALLTPEVLPWGFPHYRFFETFISHGAIVLSACWLVFVEGFRPTWGWMWRSWLLLHAYGLVVFGINSWLGSNYLFINRKPDFETVLDLLPSWPYYLFALEGLVVIIMLLAWLGGRDWSNNKPRSADALPITRLEASNANSG